MDKGWHSFASITAGLFVGLAAGIAIGRLVECNNVRESAITAGVAEYRIVDPATGATEFVFTPCKQD